MSDLRRQQVIREDELQSKMEEKDEEIDYLKSKVEKVEEENRQLRLKKEPKDKVMKLEQEVEYLKSQLDVTKIDTIPSNTITKQLSA